MSMDTKFTRMVFRASLERMALVGLEEITDNGPGPSKQIKEAAEKVKLGLGPDQLDQLTDQMTIHLENEVTILIENQLKEKKL